MLVQVVACTPDSEVPDVFEASKHFQLPSHLLCHISKIELQVSTILVYLGRCYVPGSFSWISSSSRF